MSVSKSPVTRRKDSDDAKTRVEGMPWEQPGGRLVTGQVAVRRKGDMTPAWASGQNVSTLPVMPREKAQATDPRGRKYRCTGEGRTAP
jgi:hypothetical protein